MAPWNVTREPLLLVVTIPTDPSKDPSNDGLYVIHKLAALVIGVTASYAAFATAVPGFASRVMPWRLSSCAACLGSGLTALLGGRGAAAMANVAACPTRPISSIRRGRFALTPGG